MDEAVKDGSSDGSVTEEINPFIESFVG